MPVRTERAKMTVGQATLVALMHRYLKGMLDPFVSLLEVHKLMYFLKVVGEPLKRLKFTRGVYGPYAPVLRHSLIQMENHLTRGFGEGKDDPSTPIELLPQREAANRVVPVPMKGSKTVSFAKENIRTSLYASSSG